MSLLTLFMLAIGLSFDTFAISISCGIARKCMVFWDAFKIATVFASLQAMMPIIGWLGGISIRNYVEPVDHWIAFGLLGIIGVKMVIDSFRNDDSKDFNPLNFKMMIGLGIATSIDALAVGISFALVEVNMLAAFIAIGFITFIVAMLGMLFGKNIGGKAGHRMEIVGGLMLIAIGSKILLQYLTA